MILGGEGTSASFIELVSGGIRSIGESTLAPGPTDITCGSARPILSVRSTAYVDNINRHQPEFCHIIHTCLFSERHYPNIKSTGIISVIVSLEPGVLS